MGDDRVQLLVVDDDREIRDLLANYLAGEGFRVLTASSGEGIQRLLSEHRIHLLILDLMLPGEDGLTICRRIRATSAIPIIILTARTEEVERIVGLEMGADDYVTKPFNPRELVARIKAVLWRTTHMYKGPGRELTEETLVFDGWNIKLSTRELTDPDGLMIDLSSGEFDLLYAFACNPRRVLSRDQLLDLTQGRALELYDRSIDVQISRLRHKLEKEPGKPQLIKTVRGAGYVFTPAVDQK